MSEKLKVHKNGQWTLEKSVTAQQGSAARNWMHSGMRDFMNKIPKAQGKDRVKAITNISKEAKSRINPETGAKEFQLFRASPLNDKFHHSNLTSWTTDHNMANHWNDVNGPQDNEPAIWPESQIMHAWVPEQHIHSHLPTMVGSQHEKGGEGEVLVEPHAWNLHHVEKFKV